MAGPDPAVHPIIVMAGPDRHHPPIDMAGPDPAIYPPGCRDDRVGPRVKPEGDGRGAEGDKRTPETNSGRRGHHHNNRHYRNNRHHHNNWHHQNKKYRCAIGSTVAGSQVSNTPSARTS
jgi:hypothetical protein